MEGQMDLFNPPDMHIVNARGEFCLPMPLTEEYVKQCEMEIVDNPELLKKNGKTVRQNIFDILEA